MTHPPAHLAGRDGSEAGSHAGRADGRPPIRASVLSARRAFTLIELLVVIAIIAIIVGITLPSLAGARSTSRRIKCLTNLKGFGTAFELYMRDSKGLFPKVLPFHTTRPQANRDDPQLLDVLEAYMDVKSPYYDEHDVLIVTEPFLCPEDKGPDVGRSTGFSYEYWPGVLILAREILRADPRPEFAVTKFYQDPQNRDYPVLADAQKWHPGNPLTQKNALYYGDWRVDWQILDPTSNQPADPQIPPP